MQDIYACFGSENVNNWIQCGDQWQGFIRCARVALNKWSNIGGLRLTILQILVRIEILMVEQTN